jgi:hypothetical protein
MMMKRDISIREPVLFVFFVINTNEIKISAEGETHTNAAHQSSLNATQHQKTREG